MNRESRPVQSFVQPPTAEASARRRWAREEAWIRASMADQAATNVRRLLWLGLVLVLVAAIGLAVWVIVRM